MSLTLVYRGKNIRFAMRLSKARWLSALAGFGLLSGTLIHLILSSEQAPQLAQHLLSEQKKLAQSATENAVNDTVTEQQIIALTTKLAQLQSQVLRLNALGERIAEDNNIPENEFNFEQAPPSGGPALLIEQNVEEATVDITTLMQSTDTLEQQIQQQEKQLKVLESLTLGHHIQQNSYLSGRPIKRGWLSSYYGIRQDPFNGQPAIHKGIDFAGKENADIIATASGVVSWAGERYGYGNLIEINHGGGIKTRYGHNKEILVQVGDVVTKGQVIAKMGSTGRSTGPHVHYEILKNDRQINPLKFVYRNAP
jgi:murein DD-endopeptidase MepM/ murein hydrolase activator NlpD